MLNQIIKLIEPKKFEICFKEEKIDNDEYVIIRPTYMSICAADQRYYQGLRSSEILEQKLPLSLIHESVGKVIYDPKGEFKENQNVVMIPNIPTSKDENIKENYRLDSLFRSSSTDGFMQNLIFIKRDRIIPIEDIREDISVLLELMSVSINAVENLKKVNITKCDRIGIWGPGSVGYATYIIIKKYFPNTKLAIIGTNRELLNYYPLADEKYLINEIKSDFTIDHAFECVGGEKSEKAIEQIINHIKPQGTISLLGVSEEPIRMNTRKILEKGLTILGNSRSSYTDFEKAIEILKNNDVQENMEKMISEIVEINDINDIYTAFDKDINNQFKTVMKWNL